MAAPSSAVIHDISERLRMQSTKNILAVTDRARAYLLYRYKIMTPSETTGTYMRIILTICFTICLTIFVQTPVNAQPTRIIYDTDMGNDVDDALALAMIHAFVRLLHLIELSRLSRFPRVQHRAPARPRHTPHAAFHPGLDLLRKYV